MLLEPSNTIDVLLVEDDIADILLFKNLIIPQYDGSPDIIVGIAHTIEEAELELRENFYDVILLDLNLPGIVALEGLERLLKVSKDIPIVVYSGMYSQELVDKALELGAQDVLEKGKIGREELIGVLTKAKRRHNRDKKFYNQT